MLKKTCKALLMLMALMAATKSFSQCSICSTPAAPIAYGGTWTATYYKGATLQLWAVNPTVAVCELDWYHVVGTDTTFLGTSDTLSTVTDTTCQYIARTKNTCSGGSTYYSSYVKMASITVVTGTAPTYTIGLSPTICSGTPTDIMLWSATTGITFTYLRNDTPSVTGSLSGTSYVGPLSVTLTNTTGSSQTVRMVIRMRNSSNYYANDQVIYFNVLNSAAPSGNHCFAPSTPNQFPSGVNTNTYAKGSNIQLMADTTVTADSVQWFQVLGTDTTYAGQGYMINVVADTACQYIARSVNACNCSSASLYYSAWKLMANYTVTASYPPFNFKVSNGMPTIASGTQLDLVGIVDSGAALWLNLNRDNANVTGSTNHSGTNYTSTLPQFGLTLTNTTSTPQLVRFQMLSYSALGVVGNTVSGYVTVLPSTSTAPAGNHCTFPLGTNYAQSALNFVKGANTNVDIPYAITGVDSTEWFKTRWPGDTSYLGNSYPVNATIDTNCRIFAVTKNVCYWSDSSMHIYSGGLSPVFTASAYNGTDPQITLTNNSPNICNATATSITISAPTTNPVRWLRSINLPVKGTSVAYMYSPYPKTLADVLTDTVGTPQTDHFDFYNSTSISGISCQGSSALTSVTVYPSCSLWANDTIGVHPKNDSICPGATATLTADTLPCFGGTKYVWSSGDTTKSISKTASGTYTVTATNACGCTATASGTIVIRSNPNPTVNSPSICIGTTATMTATGGSHYLWSNADTTASFTSSTAGTYTVTATNTYGCSATASGTLTVNANPTPTVNNDTICSGATATLTATGGTSYVWSTSATTTSITTGTAGTYTVTATNSSGCTATASGVVTVNSNPVLSLHSDTVCAGSTATLTVTGGSTYLWSTGATTASITTTTAGTYTVTATNAAGCSATASGFVVLHSLPNPAADNDTIYAGDTATLIATGGSNYVWSTGATTENISTTAAGIYTVTATNAYGCSNTATGTVLVNPLPTPTVNKDTVCAGNIATLIAGGGVGYIWSTGARSDSIYVSVAGTYTVTATNASGCSASVTGTVTVVSIPYPPAAPVFLSACSDSAYEFVFDDATAWGDNLQWSYNSNFVPAYTEYPDYDSYIIDPFTISIPGDSSVTVWFRSITSSLGCFSDTVSAVLQTNRLPQLRSVYAIDTLVPKDSAVTVVIPNSQSGVSYTLQSGYLVLNIASGNGDTLYLQTPPIDTVTVIDVYATDTSTGCPRHLYQGRYSSYSRVDSISQIYVMVSYSHPVVTCQADTLYLSVKNNTSAQADSVVLDLLINNPDFTCADTAINSNIGNRVNTPPIVSVSGSNYQISLDTIPADSTWYFSMVLFTACSEIPNIEPVSGGVVVPKNDTSNRIYVWVSEPNDTVIGVNNQANVTAINPYYITLDSIMYPIFDVDLPNTTGFDSVGGIYTYQSGSLNEYDGCVSQGDTFTRRSYFINKGSAIFTGGINIRDSMTCDGLTMIGAKIYYSNKTITLSSADSAMLLSSGYEHNLSDGGDTVGVSSDLILEETFVVSGCLGAGCESKVIMTWGCDTTNLCKTAIPTPYTYITHDCKKPVFLISRILPASNVFGSPYDMYWDSTCINTSTKWVFEVQNADTSATTALNDVHVTLNKGLVGSYSYINWTSFQMGFGDSLYGNALPTSDSLSYTLTLLTPHIFDSVVGYTSVCLQNPNIDSPILSIDMRIATLKRGDKFFFSFYTYQCCPSDSALFNNRFAMNHWNLSAYGFYCGENGDDSITAAPLDKPTGSPPYYAATLYLDDEPDAISPYAHYFGDDFGLTQAFIPTTNIMSVPDTETFCIQNLSLNAGVFADYQLLFQHGDPDYSGASGPSFRILVDISTQMGLSVVPADRVHISGNGYTWTGTIISSNASFTEVAFDIDTLALVDPSILGANGGASFDSFFVGSQICFPLTSYCPADQPTVGVQIRTYVEPKLSVGCDTCKIPLAEVGTGIHVLCPGCITPGIQIVSSTIERINFGLPDSSDIGYADNTTPITPTNYMPYFSKVNTGIAMVGDTLRSSTLEDFVDGNDSTGFTYASWDSFWSVHGDNNAYFKYLFRYINMPYSNDTDMNLRLIMDTLYYSPVGYTGIPYVIPLPVTSEYAVHNGDNFIFRLSIDTLRALINDSTISFKPGDTYSFNSYYVICGNFSIPAGSGNLQYQCAASMFSYYTTPPFSAFVLPQYESGDYFAANVDTTGHIPNDSVITPETSVYYLCVGGAPLFYDCYVKYSEAGSEYLDYYGNTTRCIKPLYMEFTAEILGPHTGTAPYYYDNFPYEFRPIPGLTTDDHININDSTSPYAFMIKSLGGCYTMRPGYTATQVYIHPTTGGGIGQYNEDTLTSGFYSMSAPPYERYSFPLLYAYATGQNVIPNPSIGLPLRIGDEFFQQTFQLLITAPVCASCPDTLYENTDPRFEAIVIPPVSICDTAMDTFFRNPYNGTYGGGFVLQRPLAELWPQPLSATPLADTSSFMVPQVLNITNDHPDNLYIYIDTSGIPQCLSLDSIVSLDSTHSNMPVFGKGVTPISVGPYLLFDIGFSLAASTYQHTVGDSMYYNAQDSLKFYFHWTCCPANFDSALYLKLPFMLNWQCVNFPTTLPDSACHIPVPDTIPLLMQPAAFGNIPVVMQPDTFSSCDTLHFSVRVQSAEYGPIHGITNILNMPPGLNIVPGSLTISYATDGHDTTIHRTLSGGSVSIPPIVLQFQDTILLSFTAVPACSYTGAAPTDIFYGMSFCNSPVSPVTAFHSMVSLGNLCGPFFTYDSLLFPKCFGDSTGRIAIGADGSTTTYQYSISPAIPDTVLEGSHFVANNVPAGIYIITVTDTARGCSQSIIDTITSPLKVSVTPIITNATPGNCFDNTATAEGLGGTPGYTFAWSGGALPSSETDTALAGGATYRVTVTDTNGCTAIDTFTIPAPPVPTFADTTICSGPSVILTADTGYSSYAWSTGSNIITTIVPGGGIYTVTVTKNGCQATDTFAVTAIPSPNPVVTIAGYDLCSIDSVNEIGLTDEIIIPTYTLNQTVCTQVCSGSLSRIAVLLSNAADADSVTIVGGTATLVFSLFDTLLYDIRWDTAGQGSISVNEINAGGCHTQVTFCIDILPSPVANFGVIGIASADTINVCANSTVNFSDSSYIDSANVSAGSISWHWSFGDDSTSTQQSPSHVYTQPGTYTVILTVSSSCACSATDSMVVVVTDASPMDIECPSVLCSGGSATYTAAGCNDVSWGAVGGTITSYTGSTVTITWGSVGSSGFGYVIDTPLSCGTCHAPSSVKIPVITPNASITGQATICPNSPTYYSLPLWPGGVYHWSIVNGSPNPLAYALSPANDYNILVKAMAYGTFTLRVSYSDPVSGCLDSSAITINVAGSVVDSANPSVGCTGNPVTFTLSGGAISRWSIVGPNGGIDTLGGVVSNSVTFTPDSAGSYTVDLISPNVCVGAPLIYQVNQTPSLSGPIEGSDSVCRNTPYTYQDSILAPSGVRYVWSLPNSGDGVIVGSNTGNTVIVKWTNAAYAATCTLKLNAVSTTDTNCVDTASKMYTVHIIEPDSLFNYPLTVCANSVSSAISAVSQVQDYYTWSFTPSNLASCVSGYDHSIHPLIQFNNVTTPTQVVITLTVTRCNLTVFKYDTVTIIPMPTVSLTADTPFCPLGNSVFIAYPSVTWPNTTYTWTLSNGDTVNTGTSTTLNYAFLDTGSYWVHVTAHFADTCVGSVTSANDSFLIRPCGSGIGGSAGTSGSGSTGGGGPCTITFGTPVIYVNTCTDSVSVSETYSPSGTVLSQYWTLDSASYFLVGTPSMTTITSGSAYHFRVNHSGYYPLIYTVTLVVGGDTMTCATTIMVTVPLHVVYSYTLECNGFNSGYVLHLVDNTDYVGPRPVSSWSSIPNNILPPSPADTGISMTSSTLTAPIYQVQHTVEQGANFCQVWFDVVTPTFPTAAFNYIDTPLAISPNSPNVCEGFSIRLQPTLPQNPLWTYHWHDNHDGATIIYYNPAKEYSYPVALNPAAIDLTVTDIYGCSITSPSRIFTIQENLIAGVVGDRTVLVQPENAAYLCPGGSYTFQYDNFPSSQTGIPNQWNWYNAATPHLNISHNSTVPISAPDGRYLCIATDQYGCQDISNPAGVIQILPMPSVTISSPGSYCAGDTVVLTATQVDSMTYSWSIPGHAYAGGNVWSIAGLAAGSYTATLTYTYTFANSGTPDQTCSETINYSFRIDSVPTVAVAIGAVTCSPYTVTLDATGSLSTGYTWSTHASGQTTEVTSGGDYRVLLTSPGGCQAHADKIVPDDPSMLIQYAPYGCYGYGCTIMDSAGIELTGPPNTIFSSWSWNVSGNPVESGTNTPVYPYIAYMAGDYSLTLTQDIGGIYCSATSPLMQVSASSVPCPSLCHLDAIGEMLSCTGDSNVKIKVTNGSYSYDTYNLTSPSGTFVGVTPPSLGTGTYTFIYATFVPNLGVGGSIFVVITVADSAGSCQDTLNIDLGECKYGTARRDKDTTAQGKMLLMPNPASDLVKVVYSTGPTNGPLPAGETLTLSLTNASGQLLEQQALSTISGMVIIDVSGMKPGTYFVTLSMNNRPVTTDKLEVLSDK